MGAQPCKKKKNPAEQRKKLRKQAPRPTSKVVNKPPTCQGVSLQRAGSMCHPFRSAARCAASGANRKGEMAACGAKGGAAKRKRERVAFGANGAGAKRRRQLAACGANGTHVARSLRRQCDKMEKACVQRVGDVEHMVGVAQENDAAHAERHPLVKIDRWAKICSRCFFTQWKRTHQAPPWLMPKPRFMSGAWGLGCIWCAASKHSVTVQARRVEHMRQNLEAGRCKQAVSRASKWSAYSQRSLKSAYAMHTAIHQHQITDLHRLSDTCFHSAASHFDALNDPRGHSMQRTSHSRDFQHGCETKVSHRGGEEPSTACEQMMQPAALQSSGEGSQRREPACSPSANRLEAAVPSSGTSALGGATDPFRGRVPQGQDWLDVWAETTSSLSIQGLLHIFQFWRIYGLGHCLDLLNIRLGAYWVLLNIRFGVLLYFIRLLPD
jgi:hypothetical protein